MDELLETLEVHYLANQDEHVYFALLTDFADADREETPADSALVERALDRLEELNRRHAAQPDGESGHARFHLFHRRRLWNEGEGKWMGWERKRGKLHEFNRLLRGARDTTFTVATADADLLAATRYVITLDSDTQLPRDAARRLIGVALHPLNRPHFDRARGPRHARLLDPSAARQRHPRERRAHALRTHLLRPHRHRPLHDRRFRRLSRPLRRGHLHGQGTLRRGRLRGGARRARARIHAPQPRPLREARTRAPRSSPTSNCSTTTRRATTPSPSASTAGRAATGRSRAGSCRTCRTRTGAACATRCRSSRAGRSPTTCAAASPRRRSSCGCCSRGRCCRAALSCGRSSSS